MDREGIMIKKLC